VLTAGQRFSGFQNFRLSEIMPPTLGPTVVITANVSDKT